MSKQEQSGDGLVLASGSGSRRDMLSAAGLTFVVKPADVDEGAIKDDLLADKASRDPSNIALQLAFAKARAVSGQLPGSLVIGADQILAMDDQIFDKPKDMAQARARLLAMRGKLHQLHAAVAIALNGQVIWSNVDTAQLSVRAFSPEFVDDYLARAGQKILASVGAYQLEGLGVLLFDNISGDYFTILGMPLLPLLEELRRRRVLLP